MSNTLIAGAAAAALALLGTSIPGEAQSPTDSIRGSGDQVTVVGCLLRQQDYARAAGTAPPPEDASAPVQLVLSRGTGAAAYSLTGTREAELAAHVGRRVQITGTVEAIRVAAPVRGASAPVAGTAGRVTAGRPPTGAQGVTPDGSPSHEPGDAVPGTDPTPESAVAVSGRAASADDPPPTMPRLNVTTFRVVEGECERVTARAADAAAERVQSAGATTRREPAPSPVRPPSVPPARRVVATGCLVRQTPAGAALSAQGGPGERFVLTDADVDPARGATSASAVPGSVPAGSGSGTIPPVPAGAGDANPSEGPSLTIASSDAGAGAELARQVGQRVEIVGTIDEAEPGGRPAPGRADAPPVGTSGRAETPPTVAHTSAPMQRITMESLRPLGGSCN